MCHTGERLLDMNDDTRLNLPERQLANELANLVADKMWRDLSHDITDGEIYDIGQSNYEAGCWALNSVGVYQRGKHNNLHKVVVPVDGVHQHMADLEFVFRDAFNELLSAFIENYVSYGTLSGGRRPFTVNQNLAKVTDLLVTNGFAQEHQDGVIWTEKIGPIMERWYIWDENGECRAELEQILCEETAANMAEALPWMVRRKVDAALKTRNYVTAMNIISKHWNGEKWLSFPSIGKMSSKPAATNRIDLRVIKLLLRKLE